MIHERFQTYFRETFFPNNEEEFGEFLQAIEQSIPRTIRIKPGKVEEVKDRLEWDGWILEKTQVEWVFSLGRREDFNPLERRIGYSMDHLVGNFYIQELAAAHPVSILADGKVQEWEYLILDMASSPGWKTTQLAEYFPNSFIVANEPTRERIPQLLQNLDRMWSANIWVTLYPGQYWKHYGETFDRILLDAPCSWEWTLYKWTDATKHWHIKNIKMIAKLQEKLLDASLHALKVWWEMIYSTCALNLLENEWVVNSILSKYPWIFEVTYQKKFWPHIDKTGGFFVTRIHKINSIGSQVDSGRLENTNKELKLSRANLWAWKIQDNITLYEHGGKILAVKNAQLTEKLSKQVYFMRFGEYIGQAEKWKFTPSNTAYKYLDCSSISKYQIKDEEELDTYLRGNNLESDEIDGPILIVNNWIVIGLEEIQGWVIGNSFPWDWQRK
jgi:16S rRNA (cytosine1407-C5)-methyltransferase